MIHVAMLWLTNEKGELLLARRADHVKHDPGLWGPSVTGKVEKGETFQAAAIREAEEELALSPGSYTSEYLFATDFLHPDGVTRRFNVFVANISTDTAAKLTFDPNEVAEIKWLPMSEIKELLNSRPGEVIVPSAFVLWRQIFEALEAKNDFDVALKS